MSKSVMAVIVTYNRKELLKESITALLNVDYDNLKVLIVDNNSTDGTDEFIKEYTLNQRLVYKRLSENLGGAGGFSYGIKQAVLSGCDYIWVMDDDCIVSPDALSAFLAFAVEKQEKFGFLSSKVLWKDGTPCLMNVQKTNLANDVTDFNLPQRVVLATFVSLFLPASVVEEVGLPIKEFFIWGDDWEYTYRIAKKYPCYFVPNSVVTHKCNQNMCSDISKDNSDRIARYKYAYRNECYFYQKNGFKAKLYHFLKINYHYLKVLLRSDHKAERLKIISKYTKEGKKFNPSIEYVYRPQTKVNVLEFFAEPLSYGGQEAFMLNMYNNFGQGKINYTLCTPFYCDNAKLKQLAAERGDTIVAYNNKFDPPYRKPAIKKALKRVLSKGGYDVVHIQTGSTWALLTAAKYAKKYGVKRIIVHSHCAGNNNFKYRVIKAVSDRKIKKYANVFLACSDLAAQWKFPKDIIENKQYSVIKNGIDVKKFTFDITKREDYRNQLNLGNSFTLCNVGRFAEQKNQTYILEIAKRLKAAKSDFKVVMVGEGELKSAFVSEAEEHGLNDKFIYLERRSDVAEIMMACDAFVLPSLYEGLAVASVESQATGLYTLCSASITRETEITDIIRFIDLQDIDGWVNLILAIKDMRIQREKYAAVISAAGYDAATSARELEEIYLS